MPPITTEKNQTETQRDRRIWLEREAFALSKTCPADHANPKDCPLCDLRPLPIIERRAWISQLSDEELEYLSTYHASCYANKTAARGSRPPQ